MFAFDGKARKHSMQKTVVTFAVLSALIAACVGQVTYSAKDETFLRQAAEKKTWRKITVLPFSGDPAFRRVGAEWFAYSVRKHGLFEVVSPSLAEIELKKQGFSLGEADIGVEDARKAALALGADAVIVGSIKHKQYSGDIGRGGPWPLAGVSIVDVSTGRVLATSIQSSQVLFSNDKQDFLVSAVDRVVEDVLPVLYAAAGRPWTLPEKKERPAGGTGVMPW